MPYEIVKERIQAYAEKFTSPESEVLRKLGDRTFADREDARMLSGFYQGRLLSMFSALVRPRLVLEIGTYVGFSAMCLAEGLQEGGRVITIDVDEDTNRVARRYWDAAGIAECIDARLGNAADIIPEIREEIDLVFIDADKENYSRYFELVFPKLREGGLIIADNVLWSGDVLNADDGIETSEETAALHRFNGELRNDPEIECVLLTVRDGLMVARKL